MSISPKPCSRSRVFRRTLQLPRVSAQFGERHALQECHAAGGTNEGARVLVEKLAPQAGRDHPVLIDLDLLCQLRKRTVVLVARKRGFLLGDEGVEKCALLEREHVER